jgi:hypothetical protein
MSRNGEDWPNLEKGMESIQLGNGPATSMPPRSVSTPVNAFSGASGLFSPGPSNFNPEPGGSRSAGLQAILNKLNEFGTEIRQTKVELGTEIRQTRVDVTQLQQQRAPSRRSSRRSSPASRVPSRQPSPDPIQQRQYNRNDDYYRQRGHDDDRHRNPQWKTSEFGYFWPDLPASYGYGRIIDHDNARIFRDVNSFITHIRGSIPYYGAETIRNNLPNTFKGQAFTWYNDILSDTTKDLLRRDPDPTCKGWCDELLQNFKQSGAHAMKEITSPRTNYTLQMLKRGDSIVEWFSGMVSLAADADFRTDEDKLNFIYHKFDAELRKDLPPVQPGQTVQRYSQLLRECEESLRDAAREQDRRLGLQFNRYGGYGGYGATAGYSGVSQAIRTPPRYDQYRRDTDTVGQPERATNSPLLSMEKEHQSPRKPPATANFQNYRRPTERDRSTLPSFLRKPFDRSRTIAPSRPCRFCGGNHFDSVCRKRDAVTRSPRVQFIEENGQRAVYHVEETGDALYDYEHQDWVDWFFSAGYSLGDLERYAAEYGDGPIHDEVECGHFTAKTAPPTPTRATANAVIARQAAPQKAQEPRRTSSVQVFHTTTKATIECEQCQAQFPSKTKLFKHLRQTNHFTPTVNHVEVHDDGARRLLEDSTMGGVWAGNDDFDGTNDIDDIPAFHGKTTLEIGVPKEGGGKFGAENVDVNSSDERSGMKNDGESNAENHMETTPTDEPEQPDEAELHGTIGSRLYHPRYGETPLCLHLDVLNENVACDGTMKKNDGELNGESIRATHDGEFNAEKHDGIDMKNAEPFNAEIYQKLTAGSKAAGALDAQQLKKEVIRASTLWFASHRCYEDELRDGIG